MDASWPIPVGFLAGIALLVWLLMRDVRKERERPRRWWQKKKWDKKRRPVTESSPECPFGGVANPPIPPHQCGGGGEHCGGF